VRRLPVPPGTLLPGEPAPADIYDEDGTLLLAEGRAVDTDLLRQTLASRRVFVDEAMAHKWKALTPDPLPNTLRLAAAGAGAGAAVPEAAPAAVNARAGDVKPAPTSRRSRSTGTGLVQELSLAEDWDSLHRLMIAALREATPGSDWLDRVIRTHRRVQQLGSRSPDGSLYYMIYLASQAHNHYSALHSLLGCLVCHAAARVLGWPKDWLQSVGLAALTMNAAMAKLQDELGNSDVAPTVETRQEIEQHGLTGLGLLRASGVEDPIWAGAVRWRHTKQYDRIPFAELSPANKLARLLMRVDMFTARLSRRRNRASMSPLQAAQQACSGPDGNLDEIGSAMLKALGLYPPGTFVELANQELGIVVARGSRPDLPRVVSLREPDGRPLSTPALRDTNSNTYRVARSLSASEVNLVPNHELMISMI